MALQCAQLPIVTAYKAVSVQKTDPERHAAAVKGLTTPR